MNYESLNDNVMLVELSKEEIRYIIENYTNGQIPDYQMSALLMAICFQDMTAEETVNLTLAFASLRIVLPNVI